MALEQQTTTWVDDFLLKRSLPTTQSVKSAQLYTIVLGLFTVIILTQLLLQWTSDGKQIKVPIPLALQEPNKRKRQEQYLFNSRAVLAQGYAKFKDKPFGVDAVEGVKLILPTRLLDALKSHPSASFEKSIDNDLLRDYTRVGGVDTFGVKLITTKLNPSLPAFTPLLHNLVRDYISKELGHRQDWAPIKIHHSILIAVAKASAYVLHSEDASNNQTWLDITAGYVMVATELATILKPWRSFLRPLVCHFMPQKQQIARQFKDARGIIKSTLEKRTTASDPPTMLDHLTTGQNEALRDDIDQQVDRQLLLAVASIHTTSSSTMHCLYDLAFHPEYITELREEARQVLKECGGTFTKEGLSKLEKLDSFMRESQRLNSPDLTTFQRIATEDITLPDGLHIPARTKMEVATSSVNMDDSIHQNGASFDGLRFYKKRQSGDSGCSYTSVNKTSLGFGVGRHACPGRFLAEVEMKLLLSEILLNYDIRNPAGMPRHKNLEFETIVFPDPEAEVILKSAEGKFQ